jgi:(S)-citramalyl-CoA lyase
MNLSLPGRCLLFVPAVRPDCFEKAAASGADVVCVDLEDSIPPGEKPAGREHALRFLAGTWAAHGVARAVRLNALSTRTGLEDLLAITAADAPPDILLIPKVRNAADLRLVRDLWRGASPPILALVETASGILHAREIAAVSRAGLMFGAADLSTEMGVATGSEPIDHARLSVTLAARVEGVGVMDTPSLEISDLETVGAEARRAQAWGMAGKAAIHPAQVPIIQAAFMPGPEEIARAKRALVAFAAAGERATLFEGQLLEKPLVERFRRTLRDARENPAVG